MRPCTDNGPGRAFVLVPSAGARARGHVRRSRCARRAPHALARIVRKRSRDLHHCTRGASHEQEVASRSRRPSHSPSLARTRRRPRPLRPVRRRPPRRRRRPPASPFTANINVTTNYKFRGQDQGNAQLTLAGRPGRLRLDQERLLHRQLELEHRLRRHTSRWTSTAATRARSSRTSATTSASCSTTTRKRRRRQLQHHRALRRAVVQWLSLKYSDTVSNDYFGIGESRGRTFRCTAEGPRHRLPRPSANYPVIDKLTLNAHVGYTRYASDLRDAPNVGVPELLRLQARRHLRPGLAASRVAAPSSAPTRRASMATSTRPASS